jgi:hypothetical protein
MSQDLHKDFRCIPADAALIATDLSDELPPPHLACQVLLAIGPRATLSINDEFLRRNPNRLLKKSLFRHPGEDRGSGVCGKPGIPAGVYPALGAGPECRQQRSGRFSAAC